MILDIILLLVILSTGMLYATKARKLTIEGAFVGTFICFIIYAGTGFTGIIMIVAFFLLGSSASSFKSNIKERLGLEEANKGKRTAYQVLANIGVAGSLGLLILLFPEKSSLFTAMLAASLASATGDTLSSELGNIYGRNFYNVLTFKKDRRGLDGVISIEGCIFGIVGSSLIALIYGISEQFDSFFILIILAGTIGNFADSILGATLQRKNYLSNNSVNFLNTTFAALSISVLSEIF